MISPMRKKPLKCPHCSFQYRYGSVSLLLRHISSAHKNIKPFKCENCSHEYGTDRELKRHKALVHSFEKCYQCGCDFIGKRALGKHQRGVHKKTFTCIYCNYKCQHKGHITTHINSLHLNNKLHRCPVCSYTSCYKSSVTKHVNTVHTRTQAFRCHLCAYGCSRKQVLIRHIKIAHEKLDLFQCHICCYKCSDKRTLKRHVAITHKAVNVIGAVREADYKDSDVKEEVCDRDPLNIKHELCDEDFTIKEEESFKGSLIAIKSEFYEAAYYIGDPLSPSSDKLK